MADYTNVLPEDVKEALPPCSGEECYFQRYCPAYKEACKTYFGDESGKEQKITYLRKRMLPLLAEGRVPEGKDNLLARCCAGTLPKF